MSEAKVPYPFADFWNPWVVLCLRRLLRTWMIFFGLLGVVGFHLLVFAVLYIEPEIRFGEFFRFLYLFVLGIAGVVAIFMVCSNLPAGQNAKQRKPLFSHLLEFSPIEPARLVSGAVLLHALTFFWLLALLLGPWLWILLTGQRIHVEIRLYWLCYAYFFSLLVMLFALQTQGGGFRPELLSVFFLFADVFTVPARLLLLLLFVLYGWVGTVELLRPFATDRAGRSRLGQTVFLLAGAGYWFLGGELLPVPVFCFGVAAAGAIGSMSMTTHPMSTRLRRELAALPPARRIAAFVFAGPSSGGWLWCLLTAAAVMATLRFGELPVRPVWGGSYEMIALLTAWLLFAGELAAVVAWHFAAKYAGRMERSAEFLYIMLLIIVFGAGPLGVAIVRSSFSWWDPMPLLRFTVWLPLVGLLPLLPRLRDDAIFFLGKRNGFELKGEGA